MPDLLSQTASDNKQLRNKSVYGGIGTNGMAMFHALRQMNQFYSK
jgi:hypothetical protein